MVHCVCQLSVGFISVATHSHLVVCSNNDVPILHRFQDIKLTTFTVHVAVTLRSLSALSTPFATLNVELFVVQMPMNAPAYLFKTVISSMPVHGYSVQLG